MTLNELLIAFVLYGLIPLWLIAGLGDWFCHRSTGMSETAGAKESIIHLLMLLEIGLPLLAGLLLEINALVIAFMLIGLILHEITGIWDLRYAHSKRDIKPIEQHIHSFQEVIPLMAFSIVALLHWEQFIALLILDETGGYVVEWKHNPLPAGYIGTVIVLGVVLEVLPFAEEFWRSYKINHGKLVPEQGNSKVNGNQVNKTNWP